MKTFKDSGHLFRLAGVFLVGFASFLVVRALLVPKTFGEYGHYRGAALGELTASPFSPRALEIDDRVGYIVGCVDTIAQSVRRWRKQAYPGLVFTPFVAASQQTCMSWELPTSLSGRFRGTVM
jgi:hypothetical protein